MLRAWPAIRPPRCPESSGSSPVGGSRSARRRRSSPPRSARCDDVHVKRRAVGPLDVLVAFFVRAAELDARLEALAKAIYPDGGLWIAWPKRASGVPTDLTEDVVRELALAIGLVDNKVCAIDETWSGLRIVHRLRDRPKR